MKTNKQKIRKFKTIKKEVHTFVNEIHQWVEKDENRQAKYCGPGRCRTTIRRLYKELRISAKKHPREAADLLALIFSTISNTYNFKVFRTINIFKYIDIPQVHFFKEVLKLYNKSMVKNDFAKKTLHLLISIATGYAVFHIDLAKQLVSFLNTPESREFAINHADMMRKKIESRVKNRALLNLKQQLHINILVYVVYLLYFIDKKEDLADYYFLEYGIIPRNSKAFIFV